MTNKEAIDVLNEYARKNPNDINPKYNTKNISHFKKLFEKYGWDRNSYLVLVKIVDSPEQDRDELLNQMLVEKRNKKLEDILNDKDL